MRVAVVAETFLPEINGVTNSVLRVTDHLRSHGHEVLVIAPAPGPSHHGDIPVERVAGLALPGYRSIAVGLPAVGSVERLLDRFHPDVVHVAAPVVLGAAGLRAARNLGIPTVAVFQTDLAAFARKYHLRAAGPTIWRWLRRVHRLADLNLAPSTHTLWDLRRRGIDRLGLWGRGVDHTSFHPRHRSDARRADWDADPDTVVIGYMGRIAHEKNLKFLKHLDRVRGTRLVLVGDGPARPMLEQLLPRAVFTGFQGGRDLSECVASFDVFVHPGAAETFCQAVQEAMASGVPPIVPAHGGPVDLVTHGHTGYLFTPGDRRMLAAAVQTLVDDAQLRRRLGTAAYESVRDRTWSGIGDQLVGYYASVIGGSAAS